LKTSKKLAIFPPLMILITIWFNFIPFVDYYIMGIPEDATVEVIEECDKGICTESLYISKLVNTEQYYETSLEFWQGEISYHVSQYQYDHWHPTFILRSFVTWFTIELPDDNLPEAETNFGVGIRVENKTY